MVTPDSGADTSTSTRLVLASASPARLSLLRNAGFDPEVRVSDVDESGYSADTAVELAGVLARAKAENVARGLHGTQSLVIGCDSVLAFGEEILGKPATEAEAVERWQLMRGKSGTLVSGHCLVDTATGRAEAAVAETTVRFGELSDAEIHAYVATGEPVQVAGAFTIDGIGGPFVESLDGDWSNVVGLSLPTFRRLLAAHGLSVSDLWRTTSTAVDR